MADTLLCPNCNREITNPGDMQVPALYTLCPCQQHPDICCSKNVEEQKFQSLQISSIEPAPQPPPLQSPAPVREELNEKEIKKRTLKASIKSLEDQIQEKTCKRMGLAQQIANFGVLGGLLLEQGVIDSWDTNQQLIDKMKHTTELYQMEENAMLKQIVADREELAELTGPAPKVNAASGKKAGSVKQGPRAGAKKGN